LDPVLNAPELTPASNQPVGDTIVHQRILYTALMYSDHCFNLPPNADLSHLPLIYMCEYVCDWLSEHTCTWRHSFYHTFSKNSASL